jgi:hypothetical protein
MPNYKGVCCTCQQGGIPVVRSPEKVDEFGEDLALARPTHPFRWRCGSHDAFGSHCPGSGNTPQAVYEV